jgi:spore maturation protein SpmA
MTLSYIWLGFFLVAFLIAFVKWAFLNDPLIFKVIVDGILNQPETVWNCLLN